MGDSTTISTTGPFLRVDEAARLLGVSRSHAYEMANRWIASHGAEGLPAIRLGRRLLVRRDALERWADEPANSLDLSAGTSKVNERRDHVDANRCGYP